LLALLGAHHILHISRIRVKVRKFEWINPLNAKLNPICHLLALLGAHPILHVSRIRVKHVVKINDGRTINKLPEGKPGRGSKQGRPRLRWMDDVESDLMIMIMSMENGNCGRSRICRDGRHGRNKGRSIIEVEEVDKFLLLLYYLNVY
jgi:hypothetical protein